MKNPALQALSSIRQQPITLKPEKDQEVDYTERLNAIEAKLIESSCKDIEIVPDLLTLGDTPIIKKYTINTIQGKEGTHKSRTAELLISLFLKRDSVHNDHFLGFRRNPMERPVVALVDTERNLKDELPFALQAIKRKAGYSKEEQPHNFRFVSLKAVPRRDRLKAMKDWVTGIRSTTTEHLFVVLDVVTDCVSSFNNDAEAMELFDFIGNMCEDHNCTFLLVIHENPGSEAKARGHVGTESANKASTALQVSFVLNSDRTPTDLIKLKFRKLRRAKRPDPLNLTYSQEQKGLILAPAEMVEEIEAGALPVAPLDDVREELSWIMEGVDADGIKKKDIIERFAEEFDVSKNTIKKRLEIIEAEAEKGKLDWLKRETGKQRAVIYVNPEKPSLDESRPDQTTI